MDFLSALASVNYLAVTASMVASIVVGFIWYSPQTFFTIWWKGIGKEGQPAGGSNMALVFGLTFVGSWVKCLGVALGIIFIAPSLGGISVLSGLLVALILWALFIAPTYLSNNLFAGWGPKVYFIEVGNHLVDFLAAGVILSLWR